MHAFAQWGWITLQTYATTWLKAKHFTAVWLRVDRSQGEFGDARIARCSTLNLYTVENQRPRDGIPIELEYMYICTDASLQGSEQSNS